MPPTGSRSGAGGKLHVVDGRDAAATRDRNGLLDAARPLMSVYRKGDVIADDDDDEKGDSVHRSKRGAEKTGVRAARVTDPDVSLEAVIDASSRAAVPTLRGARAAAPTAPAARREDVTAPCARHTLVIAPGEIFSVVTAPSNRVLDEYDDDDDDGTEGNGRNIVASSPNPIKRLPCMIVGVFMVTVSALT